MKLFVPKIRTSCCFVAALMVDIILVLYILRHYCLLDKLFVLPVELIPHYSRSNIARHKATDCNLDSGVDFHKKFLYMIMTESCVPEDLLSIDIFGNSLDCQCDLLVLGYKERCTTASTYSSHVTHIFHPSTTWTTGRGILYNTTVQGDKKYMYYIFMDDDAKIELYNDVQDHNKNPWRSFEDFLFRLRPPIAAIDTEEWRSVDRTIRFKIRNGCFQEPMEEYVTAVFFDGMINAFHHKAAETVLEPVLHHWNRFDNTSWWFSQWYICLMGDMAYHNQMVFPVEFITRNTQHRSYPRHFETREIIDLITKDIEKIVPIEEFRENSLMQEWRSGGYKDRQSGYSNACVLPHTAGCVHPYKHI